MREVEKKGVVSGEGKCVWMVEGEGWEWRRLVITEHERMQAEKNYGKGIFLEL